MLEITYTSSHTEKVRCFCLKMNNLASETEKAKIYGIEIKTKAKRDLIMKLKLKSSNTPHTLTHHTSYTLYTHSKCVTVTSIFPLQIPSTCVEQIIVSESHNCIQKYLSLLILLLLMVHLRKKKKETNWTKRPDRIQHQHPFIVRLMQINCLKTQTFRTKKSTIIRLLCIIIRVLLWIFVISNKRKKNENEWLSVLFWKQQLAQTCVFGFACAIAIS